MSKEIAFCDVCAQIDFGRLKIKQGLRYKLESFASVVRRSNDCHFCEFLVATCGPEVLANRRDNLEFVQLSIESSSCGSVPIAEDGSTGRVDVNHILLRASRCFSFDPLLSIDFCTLPTPTVSSYVASKSLYLEDRRQKFSRRFISESIDIRLAKKWYQLCQEKHGKACEYPQWLGTTEYPERLRVVNVSTMSLTVAPTMCRYVALSYVWGQPSDLHNFQTTKSTTQAFSQKGGLKVENLPKTIADAVRVVQDMGERYLWVDALCIVQDDDYDKALYISQMDLVYACSIFAIIAGTGEDCQAGLPGTYGHRRTCEQSSVKVSPDLGLVMQKSDGFNRSKWSRRGWTYQELQLSRRALIFYENRMFWNCECDFWVEDMCLEPLRPDSAPCFDKTGVSLGLTTLVPRFDLHTLGYHIFYYNAQREFTNEGDALDAFRGILNRIERVTGIDFYWGLPCKNFHHALLWRNEYSSGIRDDLPRSSPCKLFDANGIGYLTRIPSWSWLGWYTHWYLFSYPGDKPKDLRQFFEPSHTDWAAEWYRVDLKGFISEISTQREDFHPPSLSGRPHWVGAPISSGLPKSKGSVDYGRIVAQTSFNQLRIRTTILDIESRKKDEIPIDSQNFDLLDEKFEILGKLYAKDLLGSAQKWDENLVLELEAKGSVHDFIVISREKHVDVDDQDKDEDDNDYDDDDRCKEHFEYKLNLMSIQWSSEEPGVASRRSLFQIDEQLWIASSPQWRQVILE